MTAEGEQVGQLTDPREGNAADELDRTLGPQFVFRRSPNMLLLRPPGTAAIENRCVLRSGRSLSTLSCALL